MPNFGGDNPSIGPSPGLKGTATRRGRCGIK